MASMLEIFRKYFPTWNEVRNKPAGLADKLANLVEDLSPQLGGDLQNNQFHRVFDLTLTDDGTAAGDIITVIFGENVSFNELCYPDPTENEWMKALATNAAVKHPCMGIALETAVNAECAKLLLRGTIRDDTAYTDAAPGDIAYLSDGTAGDILYAAPADAGDIVQIVGFIIAENYLFFNPDYTYVEVP